MPLSEIPLETYTIKIYV